MAEIPRWGRVTAQPHEYLVHIRGGRVIGGGQGASCFKWPSDAVALVPTSVEKLGFLADQVTKEKVGVEVRGLAVVRIVEPLLAYRMMDGGTGRLTEILRDMCIGATRRIVAGLSLEECIAHRKERVAAALVEEIAPILAGEGAAEDSTRAGWGVVVDTIEIQDVRVQSEEVFQRLQAPFREQLALDALRARTRVEQEQEQLAAERARTAERRRRELSEEEQARVVAERARAAEASAHREALAREALEAELAREAARAEAEVARTRRLAAAEREAAEERLRLRERELEIEAAGERGRREARGEPTEAQLREVLLTETMPRVAEAFRGSFERISLTQSSSGGGELFAFLSAGLDTVLRAGARAKEST